MVCKCLSLSYFMSIMNTEGVEIGLKNSETRQKNWMTYLFPHMGFWFLPTQAPFLYDFFLNFPINILLTAHTFFKINTVPQYLNRNVLWKLSSWLWPYSSSICSWGIWQKTLDRVEALTTQNLHTYHSRPKTFLYFLHFPPHFL